MSSGLKVRSLFIMLFLLSVTMGGVNVESVHATLGITDSTVSAAAVDVR